MSSNCAPFKTFYRESEGFGAAHVSPVPVAAGHCSPPSSLLLPSTAQSPSRCVQCVRHDRVTCSGRRVRVSGRRPTAVCRPAFSPDRPAAGGQRATQTGLRHNLSEEAGRAGALRLHSADRRIPPPPGTARDATAAPGCWAVCVLWLGISWAMFRL